MAIEIRQIVHCTESDLDLGASVLCKAFENVAFAVAVTGYKGPDTIMAFERALIAAAAIGGIVYFAYDEHGSVVGVSLWFQPGHSFLAEKEQREAGMDQVFASFSPELRKWWAEQICQFIIGVSPEKQGRGIGAALVKAGEDRKIPVVLEASLLDKVEKFYKKLGYRVEPSGPPEHPEYEEYTDFEGKFAFNTWLMVKEF